MDARIFRSGWLAVLLMAHDRTLGNDMNLNHEFLALMLSSRRAGVTEAIGHFKEDGLIDTFGAG